ncbi:MAG: hypothetical protein JW892_08095 [Anaerolineae bacterium]|nr:hypothetical protein [Anaerolineae bacterium]
MTANSRNRKPVGALMLFWVGLLLLTTALYAPALRFGFIWDDPVWFGRVVGKSLGELIAPLPEYHFYRPGTLLINRLFMRTGGVFDALPLHAFQIAIHLLNVALVARLCRALRLGHMLARGTALLFALYPLAHQAVAWAAPQQSWVTCFMLLTAWLFLEARRRASACLLFAALLAYGAAIAVQESAVQMLPWLLLIDWRERRSWRALWRSPALLLFLPVTVAYLLFWIQTPKYAGVTTLALESEVLWYLLQGLVFPLVGFARGFPVAVQSFIHPLMVLELAGLLALLLLRRRGWHLGLGLSWYGLQLLSTYVGLDYAYVSLSSRLLYLSAFGAALLWAAALLPDINSRSRLGRMTGFVALALVALQSVALLLNFQTMYMHGATLQASMLKVLAQEGPSRSVLVVNYPDRYAPRRSPYPLGYWGVTLAPVRVALSDFAQLSTGVAPATESWSVLALGPGAQKLGPYQVDMRGGPVAESTIYERAQHTDATYVTRYHEDGTMKLHYAGTVDLPQSQVPVAWIAQFGAVARLLEAEPVWDGATLRLHLRWQALGSGIPTDSVFVHLASPDALPVAQADGEPGWGFFPLWSWQAGNFIDEERVFIPVADGIPPGVYNVNIGIYNWDAQTRAETWLPDGTRLPDNYFTLGQVRIGEP